VLFALSPILSAMIASMVTSLCGSLLNEGGVHRSIIGGVDVGGLLYHMFVVGWLSLITIQIGLLGICLFTLRKGMAM